MSDSGMGPSRGRRAVRVALVCALVAAFAGPGPPVRDAPPSAPRSLSGTAVSDTRVDLSWQPPSSAVLLSHYVIYRDGASVGTTTSTSFSDPGLQASTTYQYEVSAVDITGEGPRAGPVSVTTMAGPGDTTPPTMPTGLQADPVAPTRVDLSWQAATDAESGVAHYRIYRDGAFMAATSGTAFSDIDAQPQTTYTYEVSAVNGDGLEGARSASASATTPAPPPAPDSTPPTAPSGLDAQPVTARQIDLAWSAATDPESGIAAYRVFRDGSLVTSTNATAFSDAGLEPATFYVYQVSAVNGEGLEGARSAGVQARTPAAVDTTPPAAPGPPRIVG